MAEVGVFTLESLVNGMYPSSLDTFREYIQNSCDAIDKARADKILAEDGGTVEITIDKDARRITIEDDGTGISVLDFKSTLTNIGYSDKSLETDRGFRGIGRLCGLAYCRELRFVSTAHGEGIQSTVIFDAAKLSKLFQENFYTKKKYTVKEALDEIVSFDTVVADNDEHFFRVELIDIVGTNNSLLDIEKVRDYLSFVAPVTYSPQLYYQELIYKHANELGFKITEYRILVNGEPVVKNYKTNVRTYKDKDEIFGVDFHDFRNDEEKLIAWSWVGLSEIKGVLSEDRSSPDYKMRGVRLRAGNIQIGNQEVFKNLFKEGRGMKYFIGEVHAVDKNLIPNARRDYLEENPAYKTLEAALIGYFAELNKIYRTASKIRSEYTKIHAPAKAMQEFQKQSSPYQKSHKAEHTAKLVKLNKAADSAKKKISELQQKAEQEPDSAWSRVVLRMIKNHSDNNPPPSQPPQPPKETGQFPPSTWRREKRDLYFKIRGVILDNPQLKGTKLLDKINEVLAQ